MELIETPLLLRYGIKCSPLLLTTGAILFLLEDVYGENEEKLSLDLFKKVGDGRFISRQEIKPSVWLKMFPDAQMHFYEPKLVKAKSPGKSLSVPVEVLAEVESLTKAQLKELMLISSKQEGYIKSEAQLSEWLVKGWVEKPKVAEILISLTEKRLEHNPDEFALCGFLNALYSEIGISHRASVNVAALLELMELNDDWERSDYHLAIPVCLAKSPYQLAYIIPERWMLGVYSKSLGLSLMPFDSLGACYRYLHHEGYTKPVETDKHQTLAAELNTQIESWKASVEALIRRDANYLTTTVTTYEERHGTVRICTDGHGATYIADPDKRLLAVARDGAVELEPIPPEWWLDPSIITSHWLKEVIFAGVVASDPVSDMVPMERQLEYPQISVGMQLSDAAQRRRYFSEYYWLPIFEPDHEKGLTLAQRVYLGRFYKIVERNLYGEPSADRIFVALRACALIRDIVMELAGEASLVTIYKHVNERMIALQVICSAPVISVTSTLLSAGHELAADLLLSDLKDIQAVLLLLTDEAYIRRELMPLLCLNWPLYDHWWLKGINLSLQQDGWCAKNGNVLLKYGFASRASLSEALRSHVCTKRSHTLKLGNKGSDCTAYLSKRGIYYPDPETAKQSARAFKERPNKKAMRFVIPDSMPVEQVSSIEVLDPSSIIGAANLRDAVSILHWLVGLPEHVVNHQNTFGLHVTEGVGRHASIALWNDQQTASTSTGGIAYAWALLWYESLTQGVEEGSVLSFPDTLNNDVNTLFSVISSRKRRCYATEALFAAEALLIEELSLNEQITFQQSLGAMSEDEYLEALAVVADRAQAYEESDWVDRLSSIWHAWRSVSGTGEYLSHTNYVSTALQYAYATDEHDIVSPKEVFARAFEAYVEDCLNVAGVECDLLVYGTRSEDRLGIMVYPEGYERFRNQVQFDRFIARLQKPN